MKPADVCRWIEDVGLIPIVRAPSAAVAVRAVESILAAGVSIFEITMTVPGALDVIRSLAERFGGRALVGAGTVLSADDARACIDAGAQFVVSPGLDLATVEAAQARGAVVIPGALTPTEVIGAWKAGADMVKIFPISAVGGAKYLRALRGPLPQVKLVATGGVALGNVEEYLAAGATALGIGGELVDTAALAAGQDAVLTNRARELIQAVRAARSRLAPKAAPAG